MRTVPILFTFDLSLLMPALVCITSLLENASADTFYDIYILHNARVSFTGTKLEEMPSRFGKCKITFRQVNNEFVGAYEIRGIPETAYYRLLAPELILEYDKILYSDVDVIFREDLSDYYFTEIGDNYFAGVESGAAFQPGTQKYLQDVLGIDWHKGYYYSGNLVINLKQLREDGKCRSFRELGRRDFNQQDMDIINISCNGRFYNLGPSFCLTNYLYRLILTQRDVMEAIYGAEEISHALQRGIIHYNGPKPWKEVCENMDYWWHYYRLSLAFDESFCYSFWKARIECLVRLPLLKRLKLLLRYPLDRKMVKC